jgi:hypothetical protein
MLNRESLHVHEEIFEGSLRDAKPRFVQPGL